MTQSEINEAADLARRFPIEPVESPRDPEPVEFLCVELPCIVAVVAIWAGTFIAIWRL